MASSKIMMVMSLIILVFLFGGLMMGFILQSQGVLEDQSGRATINNDATMAQLAIHVSTRAYNCNGEGGGHFEVADAIPGVDSFKLWEDWQSYMTYAENNPGVSFEDLEASTPGKLSCSGTASTLPFQDKTLLQGAANFVTQSHWGNDQEGRYGRVKFEFNETVDLGRAGTKNTGSGSYEGCYGLDIERPGGPGSAQGITDIMVAITDDTEYNLFNRNFEFDPTTCIDHSDGESTVEVQSDDGNGGAQDGALLTMNVLGPEAPNPQPSSMSFSYSTGFWTATHGDGNLETYGFRVCKGAKGYIQANTGGKNAAVGDADPSSAPGPHNMNYEIDNPPGKHGEQVGGTAGTDNQIRLFMVITKGGDC